MNSKPLMNLDRPLGITGVSIVRKVLKKGYEARVHWHNYFEIEIIVSGKGIHILNGHKYEVKRGSMYILSLYDYHSLKASEDIQIINICFAPELLDGKIADRLQHSGKTVMCSLDEEKTEYIDERVIILEKENCLTNSHANTSDDLVLRTILSEICAHALRMSKTRDKGSPPAFVQQATVYIHENFRQEIALNLLADKLNVSSGYLGKLIKNSLGKSFNEYLGDVRLKYACDLLESSRLSVSEIALDSGHSSVQYFLYVFKKHFGITPGQYRQAQNR